MLFKVVQASLGCPVSCVWVYMPGEVVFLSLQKGKSDLESVRCFCQNAHVCEAAGKELVEKVVERKRGNAWCLLYFPPLLSDVSFQKSVETFWDVSLAPQRCFGCLSCLCRSLIQVSARTKRLSRGVLVTLHIRFYW
ncbi:hypothetical protein MPH_00717 [Macrophomina phaseolina MS6]|uniref:Uncharacterized protein n=1 Tax=Macrophomina phaseolina (strain MS6) TaxID=1126212 RepID=K2S4B0_MACPH|nr:hypothetical protein MPH_00717 [Macrophomina phaseolina MS6]